jgi:hypothetical protein
MKCEVFPGDRNCKHCLRRKVDCIFKTTRFIEVDLEEDASVLEDPYEYDQFHSWRRDWLTK